MTIALREFSRPLLLLFLMLCLPPLTQAAWAQTAPSMPTRGRAADLEALRSQLSDANNKIDTLNKLVANYKEQIELLTEEVDELKHPQPQPPPPASGRNP